MPIVIHHRKLRAAKAYHGLRYEDLAREARKSTQTLADVLAGRTDVNLRSIVEVAEALGLGVTIDFVPLTPAPDLAGQLSSQGSRQAPAL